MSVNWQQVERVLVVRLRSIGDTVLSTPSLIALRRFLPSARIDVLLEDWVAPVLEGFEEIDNVISVPTKKTLAKGGEKITSSDLTKARINIALNLRRNKYDVAINLHGGTTAGFFVRASGAKYRIGYEDYQYSFLYNERFGAATEFWQQPKNHSAEQQLALLGMAGVPVSDKPKSRLTITQAARESVEKKLQLKIQNPKSKIALIHPAAAFDTKQWATENFARVAEFLNQKGFEIVAVAAPPEKKVLEKLSLISKVPIYAFDDLTLPEIAALAARAAVFVGNDSGIAHIAAAVETPTVVVFGSSNINHWRPWTAAPNEIVYEPFDCQPCAGYFCKEFSEPRCILSVTPEKVFEAIEKVLE